MCYVQLLFCVMFPFPYQWFLMMDFMLNLKTNNRMCVQCMCSSRTDDTFHVCVCWTDCLVWQHSSTQTCLIRMFWLYVRTAAGRRWLIHFCSSFSISHSSLYYTGGLQLRCFTRVFCFCVFLWQSETFSVWLEISHSRFVLCSLLWWCGGGTHGKIKTLSTLWC